MQSARGYATSIAVHCNAPQCTAMVRKPSSGLQAFCNVFPMYRCCPELSANIPQRFLNALPCTAMVHTPSCGPQAFRICNLKFAFDECELWLASSHSSIGQSYRLAHLSICAIDNIYKNGWLDLNAVCSNERDRSTDACIRWGSRSLKDNGQFWGNLGHPILIDGIFSVRGGDTAHPKLIWTFLLGVD